MSALYKAFLAMYNKRNSFLLTPHSQGDSGGALLAQDRDLLGWSAVGIVSYQPGAECGTDNYVVFTEIRSESELGAELMRIPNSELGAERMRTPVRAQSTKQSLKGV